MLSYSQIFVNIIKMHKDNIYDEHKSILYTHL